MRVPHILWIISMTKSMYEIIKYQNGEAFAKAIRSFDSGIFEIPNLPRIVRYAGREAYPILPYLASLKPKAIEKYDFKKAEDVFKLAQQAGYKLIYADSLEKQNSIRHLFLPQEELCTFRDSRRFERYHIFHLVKEGAKTLNRGDFYGKETREDEYATSVLSIQVAKEGGFIKICNRYNHTVQNPDNTFYSNPEKIIKGLTLAIEKFIGYSIGNAEVAIEDGFLNLNGCLYRYHLEEDDVYYGEDFYIKKQELFLINKDYQTLVDCFLIDFRKNKITPIQGAGCTNFFQLTNQNIFPLLEEEIKDGKLTKRKEGDLTVVCLDNRPILKARAGALVYIHLTKPTRSTESIFSSHEWIEEIYFDNLTAVGKTFFDHAFTCCPNLKVLHLPKLECLENNSVVHLPMLQKLDLSSVQEVCYGCLNYLGRISQIELPKCEMLNVFTLSNNMMLRKVSLPKVKKLPENILFANPLLKEIEAPLVNQEELTELKLKVLDKKLGRKITSNRTLNVSKTYSHLYE